MLRMVPLVLAVLSAAAGPLAEPQGPPATQPASQPSRWSPRRHPVQAEIYEQLLRDAERMSARPIFPVDPRTGRPAGGAEQTNVLGLLPEGTVLVDRKGRLVRSGTRAEFQFDPGNAPEGAATSMEILRNGLLELMETEAASGVTEFVITAEVTRYRETNYLLLRKCQRALAQGNIGP